MRRIKWCLHYAWVAVWGVPVWLALFITTPVTGTFPKSITNAFRNARRYADEEYGAW